MNNYWGGVRLSPLCTSATNWPIVPATDDRRWWAWSQSVEWKLVRETEVLGENLPNATFSTTIATWSDLWSNPGRRGGQPANKGLSYDMARWILAPYPGWFVIYLDVVRGLVCLWSWERSVRGLKLLARVIKHAIRSKVRDLNEDGQTCVFRGLKWYLHHWIFPA
jgi:hypothetical protein